jgi:hypothetical protein
VVWPSASDGCFDKMSVDSGKDLIGNGRKNGDSMRDWWWKQDNGVGSESGRVKDYVRKRLEWWASLDEERMVCDGDERERRNSREKTRVSWKKKKNKIKKNL